MTKINDQKNVTKKLIKTKIIKSQKKKKVNCESKLQKVN